MFSLIITIISIALVAALALATLYYGGSAFNKGSTGATAARLINEGQQINGAVQIAKADAAAGSISAVPEALADLATADATSGESYLAQVPAGWTGALADGYALSAVQTDTKVCAEVNKRAGLSGEVALSTAAVYGCVSKAGDTNLNKVFYKF